ncbi:hypothetical protein HDA32_000551 [Spinactinospora alkalitolerans]|uniref:Uncharacterized protein n=1 Tax=Spinactinospora alkalitolerans TaxID=687207 RepID=A0A852TPM4_9ACTN|nr:hypothetical protein [Spinactinospora alkalitolerans]NYE45431.1 hypothetical protein [Spinactinospora alkalitolerans]
MRQGALLGLADRLERPVPDGDLPELAQREKTAGVPADLRVPRE